MRWAQCHSQITPGLAALLSGQVVGAWTAFETLAGDLWRSAVNAAPLTFVRLDGNPKRIAKASRKRRETGGGATASDDGKTVSLFDIGEVTDHTYDLSGRWGDLLARRFKFTSLRGIREAYSVTFSEKVKTARTATIDGALSHKGIDALAAVRNLIVHKAGVADKEYVDDIAGVPGAPVLEVGQTIALDGKLSRSLIDPVVACCQNLIGGVDSWLELSGGTNGRADAGQDKRGA